MYKALNGEIKDLTGLQDVYEEPLEPEVIVNTEEERIEDCNKIINRLRELGYI